MTALTAIFSTVATPLRGSTSAITSSAGRPEPATIPSTRSGVGGAAGRPPPPPPPPPHAAPPRDPPASGALPCRGHSTPCRTLSWRGRRRPRRPGPPPRPGGPGRGGRGGGGPGGGPP